MLAEIENNWAKNHSTVWLSHYVPLAKLIFNKTIKTLQFLSQEMMGRR